MTRQVSVRQDIWEQGWTNETVQRATAALSRLIVGHSEEITEQDRELGAEFSRWLSYAAIADMEGLVRRIQCCRPLSQSAPHWDELDGLLDRGCSTEELIASLTARYRDPAATLTALLDEVAPRGMVWDDDVQDPAICAHRRAFDVLLVLGTTESLTYALSRLELFDWEAVDARRDVVRPHGATIKSVVLEIWPSLTWAARGKVVLFLESYELIDDNILELLISADTKAMNNDDKRSYLDALGNSYDERVLPRVDEILDRALADLVAGILGTQATVRVAYRQYDKLQAEPPVAKREVAAAHGLRWVGQTFCWST